MNTLNQPLDPGLQRLIDEHLDAVDRILAAAGTPRGDRKRVTDDLELHIREMLATRAGANPTESDLQAILAELDAPELYAEGNAESPQSATQPGHPAGATIEPHFSIMAISGAIWGMSALSLLLISAAGNGGVLQTLVMLLAITSPFGMTILGCVAINQIRRSSGRIYGLGLAVFDALFYPLLLLDMLIIVATMLLIVLFTGDDARGAAARMLLQPSGLRPHEWMPWLTLFVLGALIATLVDTALIRLAWQRVHQPAADAEILSSRLQSEKA